MGIGPATQRGILEDDRLGHRNVMEKVVLMVEIRPARNSSGSHRQDGSESETDTSQQTMIK